MKNKRKMAVITVMLGAALLGCQTTVRPDQSVNQRLNQTQSRPISKTLKGKGTPRLATFKAWFGGRFDNYIQTLEDQHNKVAHAHQRVHSIFKPVDVPHLGENAFYVEQYGGGDPKRVYRQRIYFLSENKKQEIRLRIAAFKNSAAVLGAHQNPEKLKAVKASDLVFKDGCDVIWRFTQDRFLGQTKRGACRIKSKRFGEIIVEDDLQLTQNGIWIQDRATTRAGKRIFGHPEGVPHKLKRANEFRGWAAIKTEEGQWIRSADIHTHDQGGRVQLFDPKGKKLPFEVSLSQRVYARTRTSILKFAVIRSGEKKSMAYIWASPDSDRVGLNLGQFQSGLTRQTNSFRTPTAKTRQTKKVEQAQPKAPANPSAATPFNNGQHES